MEVWISLTSSLKVALLRLIDLLLHCQQNTAQTMSVKFTFLCIISVALLTNTAAISAFNFGLHISFYRGNFSLLLYTDNTCGCMGILSFLGNKLIFLPLPSHKPQMSKPCPSTSFCAASSSWTCPTSPVRWHMLESRWARMLQVRSRVRDAPGQGLCGAGKDWQSPKSYNRECSPWLQRTKMQKTSTS